MDICKGSLWGSNINYNNYNLAKKLLKIAKNKNYKGNKLKIKFVKDRPGHDYRYALNSQKILKKLKWKPKTNFNKGLIDTINWYLKNQKFLSSISKKLYDKRLGLKIWYKKELF